VGKRARRASNASNGASLITIIPLVCRYPRTIGEPFLPSVLNSPMRTPSATLFLLRCAIARTILFVFWFFRAEQTERRVSPVLHNRPSSKSSPLSSISHASLASYPPQNDRSIQNSESIIRYYARHACMSAIRVRSHPLKHSK